MKNTFGNAVTVTLFGESHGPVIGAAVDGLAPGLTVDEEYIARKMDQRRAVGSISTARREQDKVRIVSGVWQGKTTGTPLTVLIENSDTRSSDYKELSDTPRPSHADYTGHIKYGGYADPRGGGHFSGRLTAPLVAVGAIILQALAERGIYIGTHIKALHGIADREMADYEADIKALDSPALPVLCSTAAKKMTECIEDAAKRGDSVGGVLETAVIGLPAGVGEPWFDALEGMLAHGLLAIPGIKGVEFGAGFEIAGMYGSEANDGFCTDGSTVSTRTNNSGGINGGISNGMPIVLRTAVKPTPSIYCKQNTVSLSRMENTELSISGRHDPAIIHRARAVQDCVTALVLWDMLTARYDTEGMGRL